MGVNVTAVGPRNESMVYVRGFDLRQTPLLLDGIPVYVPYDGCVDLARFTTFDLSEVNVSKGYTSLLYGPNAMGGAINLISRKPVKSFEVNGATGWLSGGYRLSYPSYFGNRTNFSDDNPLTVEGVALGRRLFYEKRLSRTSTISCANCHQQARAFTDGRPFSVGFDGTPTKRNTMSLANLLWVRNFFWDGRASSLEAQAVVPLTDPHEMG